MKESGCPRAARADSHMLGRAWHYDISMAYALGESYPAPVLPEAFRWDKVALKRKLSEVKRTTRLEHHSAWEAIRSFRSAASPVDAVRHGRLRPSRGCTCPVDLATKRLASPSLSAAPSDRAGPLIF